MSVSPGWAGPRLFALAIGAFGLGMSEFVVMGMLPQIAEDFVGPAQWASDRQAALASGGWVITAYALGAVVGAPTVAGFVSRYQRRTAIVAISVALLVFNLLTAIAPTMPTVLAARFLAGLPHGAYFGIAGLAAADILGPRRRAQGIAIVLTGLTVANLVGVPLGTYVGQQLTWRITFLGIAAVFAVTAVATHFAVLPRPAEAGKTLRSELRVFTVPQVWFALGIGTIGFGGFFAAFSYVSPLLTDVAGASEQYVPIALVIVGTGMTIGTLVGGFLADRNLKRTLIGVFVALTLVLTVMAVTASNVVALTIALFFLGAVSQAATPTIQARLMEVAEDNQAIAGALNHSALNAGNSLGAILGGVVIAAGFGTTSAVIVGAFLASCGALLAILSYQVRRY